MVMGFAGTAVAKVMASRDESERKQRLSGLFEANPSRFKAGEAIHAAQGDRQPPHSCAGL